MFSHIQPVFFFLQAHHEAPSDIFSIIGETNILNFVIAFVALVIIFKKANLGSILDKRQAEVLRSLEEAEAKRAKAMAELEEIEKRTAALAQEADKIVAEAQQTAESVAQGILKNAEEEAQKLIANAQKRIELEQRTAARELESRLMREAIHGARELLENTLSADDKRRSVVSFMETLPQLVGPEVKG